MPTERYGCVLSIDEKSESLYLIGGFNHSTKKTCNTILRLNLKLSTVWDTFLVKTGNNLISKSFSASLKINDSDRIILIGGLNEKGEASNEVVEFDFKQMQCEAFPQNLAQQTIFSLQVGCEFSDNLYFFDDYSDIHTISLINGTIETTNFFESKHKFNN